MRVIFKQPIWIILIVFYVIMCIGLPDFRGMTNFASIMNQAAPYGFLGIGLTLILLNGNIDLSVGSVFGLGATTCIMTQVLTGNMFVGIIAALAICTGVGIINGFFVGRMGVTSFVVTLASMIGVDGITYIFCNEKNIVGVLSAFYKFGAFKVGPFPLQVLIFIASIIFMQFFLTYSKHGREAFVVGGNIETAKNAGIKVKSHMMVNFAICGFFVGVGAVFSCASINASTPQLGNNYEVMAIAAVVLGGTRLIGGYGSFVRTLGGAILIGMMQNSLNLLAVNAYYKNLVMGILLVTVIFVDAYLTKGQNKHLFSDDTGSGDYFIKLKAKFFGDRFRRIE